MRKTVKLITSRLVTVSLLIFLQFALIAFALFILPERFFAIYYGVTTVIGFIFCLRIINRRGNPGYKIGWIILVLLLPPFGVAVYLLFHGNTVSEKMKRKMASINTSTTRALELDADREKVVFNSIEAEKQSAFITNLAGNPPYSQSKATYFSTGESMYETFLNTMRSAKKYIFLEYFILAPGKMWDDVHAILLEKVKEGVDVRLIYDDFGSINYLPWRFAKELDAEGIKCRVFNRYIPLIYPRLNNRDHRKICSVDGEKVFTGGFNIADEYINEIERFGYWKDNAVLVEGRAAWSFTVMFLSMWEFFDPGDGAENGFIEFKPSSYPAFGGEGHGIIQPYHDNPADDVAVGEAIYLNLIYNAKKYVWITTPYLIIDYQIEQALCRAAGGGVDVRIITPSIPDKPMVFESTKSHYERLIKAGVKLYEYTPGFMHAKTFVSDDEFATVGSVNLDYRSLYLHFECGLWMFRSDTVADVKRDIEEVIAVSKKLTAEECRAGIPRRIFRSVIELIAPMI